MIDYPPSGIPASDIGDAAVVNPVVNDRSPKLGPTALIISPKADLQRCRRQMPWLADDFVRLYLSRLYHPRADVTGPALAGPVIGAPYAAMILESLVAWGCRQIIFWGWCGAIDPGVAIGDIIIPTEAVIDEGTSPSYLDDKVDSIQPAQSLTKSLLESFTRSDARVHTGTIWSTDAVYRETQSKVRHHQQAGVLGVEMELSALLAVGHFRGVDVAGVLVVSDELCTLTWRPGFKSPKFRRGRTIALEGVLSCCRNL